MKTYRGSPAAARHYVEADRGRADDYYLAEGTGVAERYVGMGDAGVTRLSPLTGDAYEAWVTGVDPDTGVAKGRLRHDDAAVRFVEVTVNGPKSWSLAAELHPDIASALDAAQDRAATQIIGWLAEHATTRVGPRGQQVQVPVEQLEGVTVRHYTSRAGDPHRHLHLQINSRVYAAGQWRGLHTVGVRDSLDAINGIGHAAVATDPQFVTALAAHGLTLNAAGEVEQLAPFIGSFSARAAQIGRNIDRYETDWRAAHPGQEPGPGLRRAWDARAWADGRPDKITPAPGLDLSGRWRGELAALGYRDPLGPVTLHAASVGSLDRQAGVAEVLTRLAARRSGWNSADVRGEVEQLLARHGLVTEPAVRLELAEDLTARTLEQCVPLLERSGVPDHIRALTSPAVLEVEADLTARLATRSGVTLATTPIDWAAAPYTHVLDGGQLRAVAVLAGEHSLVIIEGAAGAGKTTTLSTARDLLTAQGRRLVVVTPTLKAAKVAQAELGAQAGSAAWLVFQHGYRWNQHGRWTRLEPGQPDPVTGRPHQGPNSGATLRPGDVLLIDEAGMLDQDTARALLTIADEHHARVALIGDRHQLSAVGRGGVLDLAARWVDPDAHVTLDTVHRFTSTTTAPDGSVQMVPDVEYADLSLAMRTGHTPDAVFDALADRDQIRTYPTPAERLAALADTAADDVVTGHRSVLVADTRDQVAELNTAIRDRLVTAGHVDDTHTATTNTGQRVGPGDRIVTRHNDTTLDVANRDSWTVTHVDPDGSIAVTGHPTGQMTGHVTGHSADLGGHPDQAGVRHLPAEYVAEHVALGYASTVHGVQGDTATTAHLLLGEHTGSASAYVGMTRGRETNVVHLVATNLDDAREQWVAAFARDRADLGPAHAAEVAAQEAAPYAQPRPLDDVLTELRDAWTVEQDALERLDHLQPLTDQLRAVAALRAEQSATTAAFQRDYHQDRDTTTQAAARAADIAAVVAREADQIRDQLQRAWTEQRPTATAAARTVAAGPGRFRQHRAAVADARQTLEAWAAGWKPYLPSMPTDPAHLVRFAGWRDDPAALADAFNHHARGRAEHLHPEHADARQTAEHAQTRQQDAATAWHQASSNYATRLLRFGRLADIPDPAARVTELDQLITTNQHRLEEARADIDALTRDPAIRSQPSNRLTTERTQWQHDRDTTRDIARAVAAARDHAAATERLHASQQHHLHDQPYHHQPDHGIGLGR